MVEKLEKCGCSDCLEKYQLEIYIGVTAVVIIIIALAVIPCLVQKYNPNRGRISDEADDSYVRCRGGSLAHPVQKINMEDVPKDLELAKQIMQKEGLKMEVEWDKLFPKKSAEGDEQRAAVWIEKYIPWLKIGCNKLTAKQRRELKQVL